MCRLVEPPRQTPSPHHQAPGDRPAPPSQLLLGRGWGLCQAKGPERMAQRCPSHTMAPSWSSAIHIIWAANWAAHLWLGQEKEGAHPAGGWKEQSHPAALSVFYEHRAPLSLHPTSLPSGLTLATDAEQASQLVSHRTHYCSVGRNSWIDESLWSVQLQG